MLVVFNKIELNKILFSKVKYFERSAMVKEISHPVCLLHTERQGSLAGLVCLIA